MDNRIDFELPIWMAVVEHNTPKADPIWSIAFNSQLTDDREADKKAALQKMRELFAEAGLDEIRIIRIEIAPLEHLSV